LIPQSFGQLPKPTLLMSSNDSIDIVAMKEIVDGLENE